MKQSLALIIFCREEYHFIVDIPLLMRVLSRTYDFCCHYLQILEISCVEEICAYCENFCNLTVTNKTLNERNLGREWFVSFYMLWSLMFHLRRKQGEELKACTWMNSACWIPLQLMFWYLSYKSQAHPPWCCTANVSSFLLNQLVV